MKLTTKIKNDKIKLEWYVLNHDFNTKKVYNFNVLQRGYLLDLIRMVEDVKYYKVTDYKSFEKCVNDWARYNFAHKVEYEIAVMGLFDKEKDAVKISVYDQLEPNIKLLAQYINSRLKLFIE